MARYTVSRIEDHRPYPMDSSYERLKHMIDSYPQPEHFRTEPY